MSLIRFYYDPITESDRLFDDALATRSWPSVDPRQGDLFRPRMDIHEYKDSNTVIAKFELPGVKSDDITIDVHQNRLTVAVEARKSDSSKKGRYRVRERSYGKFSRTLQLPFGTKPDDVKAKMENGVLTVVFPKSNPGQQPQRIAIQ